MMVMSKPSDASRSAYNARSPMKKTERKRTRMWMVPELCDAWWTQWLFVEGGIVGFPWMRGRKRDCRPSIVERIWNDRKKMQGKQELWDEAKWVVSSIMRLGSPIPSMWSHSDHNWKRTSMRKMIGLSQIIFIKIFLQEEDNTSKIMKVAHYSRVSHN